MPSRAKSPPSQKAMGKKRAGTAAATDDTPSLSAAPSAPATAPSRQKRVLPSRTRRGGPGIGSCEVDDLILDAQKRKWETEPLIAAETKFILTTDSSLIPSSGTTTTSPDPSATFELELNEDAYQRYFDRPEVIKACREQEVIQTPDFSSLADNVPVGSRFRARQTGDDKILDTSDETYEKRHRKYEAFEKRQRLREREKLKHLHYKLKERIEQLRAMDVSAFLVLPESSFSPAPGHLDDVTHDAVEDDSAAETIPSPHRHGAAAHHEGERRRNEMLENALALDEKYQALLPPERLKPGARKLMAAPEEGSAEPDGASASASISVPHPPAAPAQSPFMASISAPVKPRNTIKVPRLARPTASTSVSVTRHVHMSNGDGESEVDELQSDDDSNIRLRPADVPLELRKRGWNLKFRGKKLPTLKSLAELAAAADLAAATQEKTKGTTKRSKGSRAAPKPVDSAVPMDVDGEGPAGASISAARREAAIDDELLQLAGQDSPAHASSSGTQLPADGGASASISTQQPPRKKLKRTAGNEGSIYASANESISAARAVRQPYTRVPEKSQLIIAAERKSSVATSRKDVTRHLMAFGSKLPERVTEEREYDLPWWLRHDPEEEDEEDELAEEEGEEDELQDGPLIDGEHGSAPGSELVNGSSGQSGQLADSGRHLQHRAPTPRDDDSHHSNGVDHLPNGSSSISHEVRNGRREPELHAQPPRANHVSHPEDDAPPIATLPESSEEVSSPVLKSRSRAHTHTGSRTSISALDSPPIATLPQGPGKVERRLSLQQVVRHPNHEGHPQAVVDALLTLDMKMNGTR